MKRESPSNAIKSTGASRAAIYVRVSTLEQGERGYSLEAQVADCRKLAVELEATVVAEYRDQDSGASWDLPGLNAMLDAAKRRELDIVLCYDPDRLARRMAKQLVIEEELQRCGVTIRYVTLRIGESAEDQLLKNVRSSIAEYERSKIALRTSRGRRAKAERGLIVGTGKSPYGYRYTRDQTGRVAGLELDPTTAPVVRRIFDLLVNGSIVQVRDQLRTEGVPTYFGARQGWSSGTITGIVANPVYLGTAAYGRRDTNQKWRDSSEWLTIAVPPLVDRATWDAVHDAMKQRRTKRGPHRIGTDGDEYILRNLITCHHCGGAVACIPNNGRRYYTCLRTHPSRTERTGEVLCTLPAALAIPLEDHVWERVTSALLDPDNLADGITEAREQNDEASARQRDRLEAVDRELTRLRSRLQRITSERMDTEAGSEADRALKSLATDVEGAIGRLLGERAERVAAPAPGLTQDDADALLVFANEVREGKSSDLRGEELTAGEERVGALNPPGAEESGKRHLGVGAVG